MYKWITGISNSIAIMLINFGYSQKVKELIGGM